MYMSYSDYKDFLRKNQFTWLITGVAGFIGSNLLYQLLSLNQKVIGIDNFSTGFKSNLKKIIDSVDKKFSRNFIFEEIDIIDYDSLKKIFSNDITYVLHQAAMGSVPKSIKLPQDFNNVNVNGFLNLLCLCRSSKVEKIIFASSSSVYGDNIENYKKEHKIGNCLSPYALTKRINELYADNFSRVYNIKYIGLRYFNVFGRSQNPKGSYAAVIPKWIINSIKNEDIVIYGDGKTSRDFTYIDNVCQANIKAALNNLIEFDNRIYNVGEGNNISLNELSKMILDISKSIGIKSKSKIIYSDFREGDIKYSRASITKIKEAFDYKPNNNFKNNLIETFKDYIN